MFLCHYTSFCFLCTSDGDYTSDGDRSSDGDYTSEGECRSDGDCTSAVTNNYNSKVIIK